MKDHLKKVSKAHIIYKASDGVRVPGTTTIVGLLNKPQLVAWANRLGLEGIDATQYRDEAADVGTLTHAMIQSDLTGTKVNFDEFSKLHIDLAENAFISYLEWKKRHSIEVVFCEKPLVSDKLRYGGTIDCLANIDGVLTLLDFKTSSAVYNEYFVQLAAYRNLLEEQGYQVEQSRILRIGRDETEGFEERTITDTKKYLKIFKNLLEIYYLKKEVKWA